MKSQFQLSPAGRLAGLLTPAFRLRFYRYPAILLLVFGAFWLRVYRLDSQALRGDEAATVHYSAMPITELWELSRVTDPHPPLYYLLLHPWQAVVGESAWGMRYTGVLAGALTVAALYGLARRTLRSTPVSLLAAALLAVNPLHIWLTQDLRSYPLFTLLGLLSSAALWHALRISEPANQRIPWRAQASESTKIQNPKARDTIQNSKLKTQNSKLKTSSWLFYVFFTVACFYTHYYAVFLIAFQAVFVLLYGRKFWKYWRVWLASQLAIGLLILPGLQLAYKFAGEAAGGIDTIPTPTILRLASTALLTGFTIDDTWGLWVSLLLAPAWLLGLVVLLRRDRLAGTFWVLFFAVPVLGVMALSIGRPSFKERFLIQAQPALELLLAAGLLALTRPQTTGRRPPIKNPSTLTDAPRTTHHAPSLWNVSRWIAALLLLTLLAANFTALRNYLTEPAYAKAPPWYLYHDYVSDNAESGDVVLTNFPEAAVSYYSPNDLPFYVVPAERDRPVEFRLEQTEEIAGAYSRIWFLPLLRQGFDEQGDVLNWLDRHGDRVDQVFFPIYNLNLYLTPPTIDTRLISQPADFASGLHLRGFQVLDEAGDSRLRPAAAATAGAAERPAADEDYLLVLEPGDEFTLSLYWSADGPTAKPYTVFTHLIAADGFTRTSRDNQPVWGTYPTTAWQPGEKITDKYTLVLPEGTPPGDHSLHVGWYASDTQARVPLLPAGSQPGGDAVILRVIIRVE